MDSTFEAALDELRASVPRFFNTPLPLFAFIDPFGVKGFRFESVRQLLASRNSEILGHPHRRLRIGRLARPLEPRTAHSISRTRMHDAVL
jgi:hypothetical protein